MSPDYTRSAYKAYKVLLALHIESLPIDPLMILGCCKNTYVHTYEEIMYRFGRNNYEAFKYDCMENKDALTIRREVSGRPVYELYYDNRGNPYRRRFTLAHELGHIILKHHSEETWEEREADYFASQLLAPTPLVALCGRDPEIVGNVFYLSNAAAQIASRQPRHRNNAEISNMLVKQFSGCFVMEG